MEGLGTILPLDEEDSPGESATDARSQGLLFVRRLRDAGWVEDLEGGYEEENRTALSALAVRLLQLFDELLHPKTVTYSGKLLKAYRLLQDMEHEKSPYENVLKEVSADMADLNTSLRQLNASIGSYIDQLTRNRTPQEVLDLFQQYEDEVVVAAYHRFKTSDNLFQDVYKRQISANLARKTTGSPEEDLSLLWAAIINMFENDHSAARGKMAVRELIVFRHDSELGCAPAWKLFDTVKIARKDPADASPARSFGDYTVSVDESALPAGITCTRMG